MKSPTRYFTLGLLPCLLTMSPLRGVDKPAKVFILAGFVWFQGWNDQYGSENEYASNMEHFIRDVRKGLNAPGLPFVIAAMGQNGSKPASGAMPTVRQAQMAMNEVPEFRGNVKAFPTDVLVDKTAEELYPRWKENPEQWKRVGGDHPYHYLGSAIWFARIGHGMGQAMNELLDARKRRAMRPTGLPAQSAGHTPARPQPADADRRRFLGIVAAR